jgi:integrase
MKARLEKRNDYYYIIVDKRKEGQGREVKATGTKSKKEGEKLLIDLQYKIQNNMYGSTNKTLFIDFLEEWLNDYVKKNCRETTYQGYKLIIQTHLIPHFKKINVALSELTPMMIQKYYYKKLDDGLSPNTIRKHHANIRKCLDYAKKMQIINFNPADNVELPKKTKYHAQFYTKEEVLKLLTLMQGSIIETPIILAVMLGLRRSEVLGLTWDDIDLLTGKMYITKTRTKYSTEVKDKTKTEESRRELILPAFLQQYLIELKNNHIGKTNYVCITPDGKEFKVEYIGRKFKQILEQSDLKVIRLHDLRHTNASLLLGEGVDIKRIQGWLGHSNFNTTADIYSHLTENYKQDNADIINNILVPKLCQSNK